MNAGSNNMSSMHHPRRWNVTTTMIGLEMVTYAKISPKMMDPEIQLGTQKKKKKSGSEVFEFLKDVNVTSSMRVL